jgi:hypothetical protein
MPACSIFIMEQDKEDMNAAGYLSKNETCIIMFILFFCMSLFIFQHKLGQMRARDPVPPPPPPRVRAHADCYHIDCTTTIIDTT